MTEVTTRAELDALKVSPDATLFETLAAIDRAGEEIVFVADENDRIVGTVTDGDVRRALLRGASLQDRLLRGMMRPDFVRVTRETPRAEVLDLMRARGINQIPILDADQRLIGLHLVRDMVGGAERPNAAVIMAGGLGKRLGPITETIPKPMVTVAGRPILERIVLHLVGHGIRRVFIAVNHLRETIEEHFGDGSAFGCRIEYLREEQPLGTGGALSLLPAREEHPVLVMNGDLVTQADFGSMLDFHAQEGFAATIGLRPYAIDVPYGVATLEGNMLTELREKPTFRCVVNAGIYVLSAEAIDLVPGDTEFPITDVFERCRAAGLAVGGHLVNGEWLDVGRPDELLRARGAL